MSVSEALRPVAWLTTVSSALAFLIWLPLGSPTSPSPTDWDLFTQWLAAAEPADQFSVILRLALCLALLHTLLVSLLVLGQAALRARPRSSHIVELLANALSPEGLRIRIASLAGIMAITASPTLADIPNQLGTQARTSDLTGATMAQVGESPQPDSGPAVLERLSGEPSSVTDDFERPPARLIWLEPSKAPSMPATIIEPFAEVEQSPSRPSTDPGRDEWLVQPGDHLWSIAEHTMAEAFDDPSPHRVAQYWIDIIKLNRDRLPDPDNPSLIRPGFRVSLPELPTDQG